MSTTAATPQIDALTGLRFFAAFLVVCGHSLSSEHCNLLNIAFAGVTFFFILSGFILAHNYLPIFGKAITRRALYRFYAARFARVYPMHFVTLAAAAVLLERATIGAHPEIMTRIFAAQLLLVQSWTRSDAYIGNFNGPAWSISDEAFFYLLTPLLLLFAGRWIASRPATVAFLAAATVWLVQAAYLLHHAVFAQAFSGGCVYPLNRLADFTIGVCLGTAFSGERLRKVEVGKTSLTLSEFLICGLVAVILCANGVLPLDLRYSSAYVPFFALLIYVFAFERGSLSRAISHPVLLTLGRISFSLYLVHILVIQLVTHAFPSCPFLLRAALEIIVSLATAAMAYAYIEMPARRTLTRLAARQSRPVLSD